MRALTDPAPAMRGWTPPRSLPRRPGRDPRPGGRRGHLRFRSERGGLPDGGAPIL